MENVKTKDYAKYDLYKFAFGRISDAIKNGFAVEALALEESIISDRLNSCIEYCIRDKLPKIGNDAGISERLRILQIYFAREDCPILNDIKQWIGKRNQAVHGIVASKDGTKAKLSRRNFLSSAMSAAKKGETLAHEVSDWVRKMKRKSKK